MYEEFSNLNRTPASLLGNGHRSPGFKQEGDVANMAMDR